MPGDILPMPPAATIDLLHRESADPETRAARLRFGVGAR
jgi:hypothetical protein